MLWQYSRKDTKVLLLATLLVFTGYGLLLARDWQTARYHDAMLTAQTVGVFVGVPENPVNSYMTQLDERARELDAREMALADASGANTQTLTLITLIGIGLLGLILLNFYLDGKRRLSLQD
jgi:hypothetical protein